MTKHLAAAVGSVLLTAAPPRPGIAEITIAPVVQDVGNPAGVGVVRIALDPQDHGIGRSAVAATTVPVAAGAPGTSARAQGTPRLTYEPSGGDFLITIQMEGASRATLRQDGREVLVSFPRPLPDFNAQTLQDQAVGLLEGVNVGFDTLLLRLTPGVTVTRIDEAGGLRLVVQPEAGASGTATPTGEPITEANKEGAQRLQLLGAQLQAQSGQVSDARQQFGDLILAMPGNPEPMSGLAGLEQGSGRWRQARALYQRAQELDPENLSVADAIAAIDRTHGGRLRTDLEYRKTDGGEGTGLSIAVIEGVSGQQPLGDGWLLGFSANAAKVNAAQVQQPTGVVESVIGWRQRAELSVQHDSLNGAVAAASAYLTGENPGFGARGELPDDSGVTFLRADYRRPNWDFFQSLVNNGTRDRIAVGRRQQIVKDLTARVDLGVNRYNLQGAPNLATTLTATAEVRLANIANVRGLSMAYVLDGEYVNKIASGIAPNGEPFNPLPIDDREVHALVLGYAGTWGSGTDGGSLNYELSLGYGVDRYGKAGPILAAVLTYPIGDLELGLRAGYVNNIGRSPGSTTIVAGSLTWFF
jgi:hypothetical protein